MKKRALRIIEMTKKKQTLSNDIAKQNIIILNINTILLHSLRTVTNYIIINKTND